MLHQKIDVVLCVGVDVDRKVKHHHHWKGALSTPNQLLCHSVCDKKFLSSCERVDPTYNKLLPSHIDLVDFSDDSDIALFETWNVGILRIRKQDFGARLAHDGAQIDASGAQHGAVMLRGDLQTHFNWHLALHV